MFGHSLSCGKSIGQNQPNQKDDIKIRQNRLRCGKRSGFHPIKYVLVSHRGLNQENVGYQFHEHFFAHSVGPASFKKTEIKRHCNLIELHCLRAFRNDWPLRYHQDCSRCLDKNISQRTDGRLNQSQRNRSRTHQDQVQLCFVVTRWNKVGKIHESEATGSPWGYRQCGPLPSLKQVLVHDRVMFGRCGKTLEQTVSLIYELLY